LVRGDGQLTSAVVVDKGGRLLVAAGCVGHQFDSELVERDQQVVEFFGRDRFVR
jgi:hypothetical protein